MEYAGKVADPRYTPGRSRRADDMTDADWLEWMGLPTTPLEGTRDIEIVCYPRVGLACSATITVNLRDVSQESDGLLTQHLMDYEALEHEWRYRDSDAASQRNVPTPRGATGTGDRTSKLCAAVGGSEHDYHGPADRYVVSLVVSYDPDRDEAVESPQDAAAAALRLTTDDDRASTRWQVYDRATGQVHGFDQSEIELEHSHL